MTANLPNREHEALAQLLREGFAGDVAAAKRWADKVEADLTGEELDRMTDYVRRYLADSRQGLVWMAGATKMPGGHYEGWLIPIFDVRRGVTIDIEAAPVFNNAGSAALAIYHVIVMFDQVRALIGLPNEAHCIVSHDLQDIVNGKRGNDATRVLSREDGAALRELVGPCEIIEPLPPYPSPHPDSPDLRADHRFQRYLHERYGGETVQAYRRLPYVYLGGDLSNDLINRRRDIAQQVPDLTYRPFDDVSFDSGWVYATGDVARHRLGMPDPGGTTRDLGVSLANMPFRVHVRVATAERFHRTYRQLTPWLPHSDAWQTGENEQWLYACAFVACYLPDDGAYGWLKPYLVRVPVLGWSGEGRMLTREGVNADTYGGAAAIFCTLGYAALAYLAQTPKILVESLPATTARKGGHKPHGDKKPWTIPAPTIHLIDPLKIPVPRPRAGEADTGIHRFVRARRGGWVTLRHPRYYQWPHCERYTGDTPVNAPPPMDPVYYHDSAYACGAVDGEMRAFVRVHNHWREIAVRRVYRRAFEWTGPTEGYEAVDGQRYRVLVRESNTEALAGAS